MILLFGLAFVISVFAVFKGVLSIYRRQSRKKEIEAQCNHMREEDKAYIKKHLVDEDQP